MREVCGNETMNFRLLQKQNSAPVQKGLTLHDLEADFVRHFS